MHWDSGRKCYTDLRVGGGYDSPGYYVPSVPIYKQWWFWVLVLGIFQGAMPILTNVASKMTIVQSQLGIITEQECVDTITRDYSAGHAVPCGSLLKALAGSVGAPSPEELQRQVDERDAKCREMKRMWGDRYQGVC